MSKFLRFIAFLALVILIIGGICIGVGFLTGAESSRVYTVVDNTYGLTSIIDSATAAFNAFISDISSAWNGIFVGH